MIACKKWMAALLVCLLLAVNMTVMCFATEADTEIPATAPGETVETTPITSEPLTPPGNLTLVDDYSEKHADGSGKQFITVATKEGNYFYLVIDRDKNGAENVHFLNLVDEADLLALMDKDEADKYTKPVEPDKSTEADPVEPDDEQREEDKSQEEQGKKPHINLGPTLFLVVALLGGGIFFGLTKLKEQKKKEQEKPDPDADYIDGEYDSDIAFQGEDVESDLAFRDEGYGTDYAFQGEGDTSDLAFQGEDESDLAFRDEGYGTDYAFQDEDEAAKDEENGTSFDGEDVESV